MRIIENIDAYVGQPCVATIGFFDGVHKGHRCLIDQVCNVAADKGLESVLITFREHPLKVLYPQKAPFLLTTAEEKSNLLAETGADNAAVLDFTRSLSEMDARSFMKNILKEKLNVRILVIGYDHRFGHDRNCGFADYVRFGKEMVIDVINAEALEIDGGVVSSSAIRSLLLKGDASGASSMLGYDYFIEGTVVGGFQNGRKIGFPTANVAVASSDKLIPANGVYAVRADVDGERYNGMLNIGMRPTFANGSNRSIEVFLFDFSGNIYSEHIRIEFFRRIRDEKKFACIEELKMQLEADEHECRTLMRMQ